MANLTQSPTQKLKKRFSDAREFMKINRWKRSLFEAWVYTKDDYWKSPEGVKRLGRVWFGYAADLDLTLYIEQFVAEQQKAQDDEDGEAL